MTDAGRIPALVQRLTVATHAVWVNSAQRLALPLHGHAVDGRQASSLGQPGPPGNSSVQIPSHSTTS